MIVSFAFAVLSGPVARSCSCADSSLPWGQSALWISERSGRERTETSLSLGRRFDFQLLARGLLLLLRLRMHRLRVSSGHYRHCAPKAVDPCQQR